MGRAYWIGKSDISEMERHEQSLKANLRRPGSPNRFLVRWGQHAGAQR
ncbi:MAG: hypothetical protein JO168_07500 [Solirubrobacterales bacterium]|nr:hypothetical protein [Solirubrobacterales bacterium]